MKSTAALSLVLAATASALRPCTKSDWEAVKLATHESPLAAACAADMNVPLDDFFAQKVPTPEQNAAFDASAHCKDLYALMQSSAVDQHCAELDTFKAVSWEMVVALMDIGAYPKTSTPCDREAVKKAFQPLLWSSDLVSCASTTGLYADFMTKTPPTLEQWAHVATTKACEDVYDKAQDILASLPHCTMHPGAGDHDIHSVEKVTFSIFVDWLKVLTVIHTNHVGQALSSAVDVVAMWSAPFMASATPPSTQGHGLLLVQAVFSGAAMALIGMYVYTKLARGRGEETRGLLERPYV
ncbi:Aste57867_11873 [Aphanomyces stellatus]|uniref:Aste57867_11873 protein n=1 Tax=Aphanomyces stellatus TaxID=120398 RepID=A0A485KU74_9STRA|nr:hypothetical protein As57867_011828 [Aphanomyces stellatus]VFT88728.1 Aste57867_11873 [Aphanomyces stellatus]